MKTLSSRADSAVGEDPDQVLNTGMTPLIQGYELYHNLPCGSPKVPQFYVLPKSIICPHLPFTWRNFKIFLPIILPRPQNTPQTSHLSNLTMPITIYPSPERFGVNTDGFATTSRDLPHRCEQMKQPGAYLVRGCNRVMRSKSTVHCFFKDLDERTAPGVIPYANGFFKGVIRAYQQDLHLDLRLDDV